MRRLAVLSMLAAVLMISACDQIPFSVSLPIVLTDLSLTTPDTLSEVVFYRKVVTVAEYDNFSQYIDFTERVSVDSALLRLVNHSASPTHLTVWVSDDTTLTLGTVGEAQRLLEVEIGGDTMQRYTGEEFLDTTGLNLLQEQLIPDGLFALYFLGTTQAAGRVNLWVDSLALYVHLEGVR